MKHTLILAIILLSLQAAGCQKQAPGISTKKRSLPTPTVVTPAPQPSVAAAVSPSAPPLLKAVFPDEFEAMYEYIRANGFDAKDGDREVIFTDSKHNRHGMMAMHPICISDGFVPGNLVKGHCSEDKKVKQISVWFYEKGIRDQKHFLFYAMRSNGLQIDDANDLDRIHLGITEFLFKIKHSPPK